MTRSFDRLARIYGTLEWLALGGDLERARFALLDRLADCRSILVLGEGDGRCLARLVGLAPAAKIHCVDSSPAMIVQTAARLDSSQSDRVRLECVDALNLRFQPESFDAVVTLFFLDCFTPAEVERLVGAVSGAARPGALWLYADFALPAQGWRRRRAQVWLALLYGFFRWQTQLSARALPPSEALLALQGWRQQEAREFQAGMLRTGLYRFIGAPAASP